nr:2-hydroxycarboxylate transporter family protein [Lelliottia amnigena]
MFSRRADCYRLPGRQAAKRHCGDGGDAGLLRLRCGEFGKRLPIVGKLGAAAICATFIPSAMVYYGLLPDVVVESTTSSTNLPTSSICISAALLSAAS